MPPSSLHDRYDILNPIAQGGMALVSLAREVDTGREVALKHLTVPPGQRVDEWRLRFQQEFHTTSRLRHPHIVATYDYAVARDGLPFFTMEYLPGPGLEALVPMSAEQLQSLLPGLLQALGYLHHQGLVHCDLKPENLRLGQDGTIRLMDLGLVARAGHPAPGLQGTLAYMPPEMVRRAALDRRSDLYALGCVLYHLLAGVPPFAGEPREVLRAQLEKPPTPLRQLKPELPERLCDLVMRLLEKDPLKRFQSANEALLFLGAGGDEEDDQTLFHPPLIGRQSELQELESALERVGADGFEEVWLHGDGDAGLEQVLEEFCCRAQLNGCTVLRGAFRPRMAPFEGLRAVVRALVALTRHHLPANSPHYAALAAVLPELGAAGPDTSDPEAVRLRVFEALTVLLRL
ncbi:MAG TPA: serine/threonine-protein kinase, partial [Oscillatoriaceae cyanobacterium]